MDQKTKRLSALTSLCSVHLLLVTTTTSLGESPAGSNEPLRLWKSWEKEPEMRAEVGMVTFPLENTKIIIFMCAEEGTEAEDSKTCLWVYEDFHTPERQVDKQ